MAHRRLEAAPLREATDWMEHYRVFWDANLDRLDAHLKRVQPPSTQSERDSQMAEAATKDLVLERVFDAPRELVYRAFIDPDQISQWFGPVGWSVPRDSVEVDARPGGQQKFTMVNDENTSETSPVSGTFEEIVENELIVSSETWDDPDLGPTWR